MKSERGLALITVIIVLAIVLVAVSATIILARSEISTSKNQERGTEVLHEAEAGISWAASQLKANLNFAATTPTVPAGFPNVRVLVGQSPDGRTVTVTAWATDPTLGDYPEAKRAIKATFQVRIEQQYSQRPFTANGTINFNSEKGANKLDIEYSGGSGPAILSNWSTDNPSVIFDPDVRFSGDPTTPTIGYVAGGGVSPSTYKSAEYPPQPVPSMDWDYWKNTASSGGTIPGGTWSTNGMTVTGPKLINGDLVINANNITLNGVFYVTGTVTIGANHIYGNFTLVSEEDIVFTENGTIKIHGNSAFLAKGDVIIQHNASIKYDSQKAGLIYAQGDFSGYNVSIVDFNGAISVQGKIDLTIGAQFNVHWRDLINTPGLQPPGFSGLATPVLERWEEIPPP
ncbi:MAG: hypothetical protein NUV68_00425 [Caldiserica bacterium]|jgi:archaellin|nr:hypothetical protein [Caldisericota bacterium]MDH7561825.1 hypothetical protein [Caldisericota bacterium]